MKFSKISGDDYWYKKANAYNLAGEGNNDKN